MTMRLRHDRCGSAEMPEELNLIWGENLSLQLLLANLAVAALLSLLLRWHYFRFGRPMANRREFGQVFPLICMTTVLIITVVKSSLALSLGLVGALSIVRFRTPVKEPEELAYLFLAIAIGLGLGADQTIATVVSVLTILVVIALVRGATREPDGKQVYLNIDMPASAAGDANSVVGSLTQIVSSHASNVDLRRYDSSDDGVMAAFLVDLGQAEALDALVEALRQQFPGASATFVDQNRLPGI